MVYRVVYDVVDDSLIPTRAIGLVMVVFAVGFAVVMFRVYRAKRHTLSRRSIVSGTIMSLLFLVIAGAELAGATYPSYADQRLCVEWARRGDYETVEGRVTGFKRQAGGRGSPYEFQVDKLQFSYRHEQRGRGGFQGSFTATDAADLQLRDGLAVRIAHRDGRILRIQTAVK